MTDRHDEPRDADELTRQVAELGDTDEDRLDAVAEHNESLQERLPGEEELPRTKGAPADEGAGTDD
ncbi:hypothetical protein P5G50_10910 [Leifsonia sp. F6_8S_P_1B]|uniref:Uncharacterized protein n=1 Tax=Leifsonia williamsii TaxID=3035919 RepID=A0ABT8KBY9_9MICO|nr:hypothetical protein [Leifsonia williamsii]MDN4614960.1 hypothetical protein [Leifsonia williamsii]